MTKNQKKGFASTVSLIWMYWLITIQDEIKAIIPPTENIYIMIGSILISGVFISTFIFNIFPSKNKKSTVKTTSKKNNSNTRTKTKQHNLLRSDDEVLTLPFEKLTWREFERLCFLFYKAKGYKVSETSEGADGGVDLVYFHPGHNAKVAVQIKFYSEKSIGVNEIRNLDSAKKNHKCPLAEFITTSTYTQNAKNEANSKKIEWHDKNWVELTLLKWRDKEAKKRKLA